jgi:hypothetical protein
VFTGAKVASNLPGKTKEYPMKNLMNLLTLASLVLGTGAFASGFICEEPDSYSPLTVKLFNKTVGGTRIPAVIVISDEHAGTILVAKGEEISKKNLAHSVRYTATPANKDTEAVLNISFKEGNDSLEEGEVVMGTLRFTDSGGEGDLTELECSRYLKNK